ncbi:MAG: hypothetical protein JJ903_09175 [Spongiibacter sp.]|uniref:hypothetical protein n=1 Tax=Spongiibacter TaxID=630749 RepID=UPI001AFD2E32|nr:hypothetical protein [Spongiibacter sp.]MBO6753234.1 hypothetical protein [Spongiibacter sp.]
MSPEEKFQVVSSFLCPKSLRVVADLAKSMPRESTTRTIHLLHKYIELLAPPIKKNDNPKLTKTLTQIRSHLCQVYSFNTTRSNLTALRRLISRLADEKIITGDIVLPSYPASQAEYEAYKAQRLPEKILSKIQTGKPSADEEFRSTLSTTCTPEIAERLKEHVYNFKIVKHHRNPLEEFLRFVFAEHPKWYEQSSVIEGSLLKFRNDQLKTITRATAYGRYQNVKNAFQVLKDHKLISEDTELPDNLRRCTNTEKVRASNPLICATFIYDERQKERFSSTSDFIRELATDLENNLRLLVEEAKKIIYEGYQKFKECNQIILGSEKSEFLNHRELRTVKVIATNNGQQKTVSFNPFSDWECDLKSASRTANLVAYFDHFYECYIEGRPKHDIYQLSFTQEVREYLGLTPLVASAMQTIIIEELGINPYSLYKVKISSNGHGQEFVQVTDDGSVRLRALKPRARHAKSRKATGSLVDLSNVPEQNIDAATCLKMALEMTSRAREFTGLDDLWLCGTREGLAPPSPDNFQDHFKKIRAKAAQQNEQLNEATLKKVRASKGVWIYLDSNGDSLKTATYLGNTVKTTLHRYIPSYITELVYRVKIRNFQHILLFMAVAQDESPADSLGLTADEFKAQLVRAFDNPDMGGTLYNSLKSPDSEDDTYDIKYFCVSLRNVMLAIKYAKEGEDLNLRDDCKAAISKISEGPVIMKQLLRQAEKNLTFIEEG